MGGVILRRIASMLQEKSGRAAGLAGPGEGTAAYDARTDRELLDSFVQRRDDAAFAALVRRHGPMVLSVCRRVLRQAEDTEDAFQATFLVLAKKADRLKRPDLLANWLYGVAYRTAQHARERAARRQQREREAATMPASRTDLESSLNELGRMLDEEMHRLPEKYRLPLVLCYLEGKTNKEAARVLGWPTGSMSHRLERARELLRDRLCARLATSPLALTPLMLLDMLRSVDLPPHLLQSTVQAVLALGTLKVATAGLISSSVLELMEATLRTLRRGGRFWVLGVALILLSLLSVGTAVSLAQSEPPPDYTQPADRNPASAGQPTASGQPATTSGTTTCPNHQ
jgi:RNA polymerase sigma factor (sigma-70 family)